MKITPTFNDLSVILSVANFTGLNLNFFLVAIDWFKHEVNKKSSLTLSD